MRRSARPAVGALALFLAACSGSPADPAATGTAAALEAWPDASPDRPVVDLAFTVADDLTSVTGTERVEFTPDLDICELVFRLWPNKPATAAYGNALEVTSAEVDGLVVQPVAESAGAPDGAPGTLVEVPLPSCVAAGATVTAELGFALTLGEGTDERVGVATAGDAACFGTAFPLLAWERGRGWARDPAVAVAGEMATSETFELRSLDVSAPPGYEVLGTGEALGTEESTGLTTHRFAATAVRDVTVTVGRLEVLHREVDGVRLHLGAPRSGTRAPLERWADVVAESMTRVADQLGPPPYEDVWVSVLPDQTDGIEFPGAVQFGDISPGRDAWLVTHEVAHLWFYGLVGNNQARDPWLDESFATFVQLVVDDEDPAATGASPASRTGQVGQPMSYWGTLDEPSSAYVAGVYVAGGAALLEARRAAGEEAFDDALRQYLADNAHRVAVPADVEGAFAGLPEVLEVLGEAGALDGPG
ncbi:MAG TPA: M1 family aminopeptidase [Jiangellales bacterium]|nr:M1 family aminopeptidase [Jiangellales bacterium]